MTRVYLMADLGDGPELIAEWFEPAHSPRTLETAGAADSPYPRWLVEAESAEAARQFITATAALEHSHPEERDGHADGVASLGRILASGGKS